MEALGVVQAAIDNDWCDVTRRAAEDAVRRNVTLVDGREAEALAHRLRAFAGELGETATTDVLAGRIAR